MPQSKVVFDSSELFYYTVIGYIFWSLVHGLGPMIWFYPLNELDITGYETFVAACFSPVLFLINEKVTNTLKSDAAFKILLAGMLGGCSSFQCTTTLMRLAVLSVGVSAACLLQGSLFWSDSEVTRLMSFWGFTVSFIVLLSSRIWFTSFMPLWNDFSSNSVLISFFAIFVSYVLFFQQSSVHNDSSIKSKTKEEKSTLSILIASLGFGASFFFLHALFGEVSVLSRYTVQGYPDTGPLPNPWGGSVLVSLIFGLLLSMHTNWAEKYLWSLLGFSSSMGLMFLSSWYGFACGLFFAVYIASIWPTLCQNAINCENPGISLIIAFGTYLIGVFGMVWCTAYNFVPFGGELARERTYVIIGAMAFLAGLSATKRISGKTQLKFQLNLPDVKYYTSNKTSTPVSAKQELGNVVKQYLVFAALFGLLGFEYRNRFGSMSSEFMERGNFTKNDKQFSALIWTFHFGYDNRGWPSMERAADVLRKSDADIITLLESDASKPYLGNNDIGMWLSEKLGMFVDFGPSTRDHTWGNLLLSKYPIVSSKHHLLPSPHGELAPAVSATVNISGNLVDFVVTHMGNDRDDLDRRLQANALANLCNSTTNPVVFLGYVTSKPGSRDYKTLTKNGRMNDIDATDRSRFCEYIMYRGLERVGYARISHGGLSDTELQTARWQIPSDPAHVQERPNIIKGSKNVSPSIRFREVFGEYYEGHWSQSNHHFHMSTPKYFTV